MDTFRIGLLGCGNIAGGVVDFLNRNRERAEAAAGKKLIITRVYARTPQKAAALGFEEQRVAADADEVIFADDVDAVLELMGGAEFPFACAKKVFSAKKPLITANKDMMAAHWNELFDMAVKANTFLGFEASVGGGIPIVGPLCDTLYANSFKSVCGILNGTTNYILSSMSETGCTYADALAQAQRLGYAEPDPTADVSGLDAARKLSVVAALAFGRHFEVGDISLEGIERVSAKDISSAEVAGCVLKLICRADVTGDGVALSVRPCAVKRDHPLASVGGSFNALYVDADPLGSAMLYGRGAGAGPTASSVAGDLIRAARCERTRDLSCESAAPCDDGDFVGRFLIRLEAEQRGLSALLDALGRHGVAVRKVVGEAEGAAVVTTGDTRQRTLDNAVRELLRAPGVSEIRQIRMLEI